MTTTGRHAAPTASPITDRAVRQAQARYAYWDSLINVLTTAGIDPPTRYAEAYEQAAHELAEWACDAGEPTFPDRYAEVIIWAELRGYPWDVEFGSDAIRVDLPRKQTLYVNDPSSAEGVGSQQPRWLASIMKEDEEGYDQVLWSSDDDTDLEGILTVAEVAAG